MSQRCGQSSPDICKISFPHFFFQKFSLAIKRVEGKFVTGKHLAKWCYKVQANPYTLIVAPRFHLKTTVMLGYLAWRLYKEERRFEEWLYMSYKEDLASKHIKTLKRYINNLPEIFSGYLDLTQAEGIIRYFTPKGCEFTVEPAGVFAFKRGLHPYGMMLDDILKDPETKLSLEQLFKIERVFLEEIMNMPKAEMHVVGTPQDDRDVFAKIEGMKKFSCGRYPAIVNYQTQDVIWPEMYSYERLIDMRDNQIGEKAFNKEMMCRPVRGEDGYFKADALDGLIMPGFPGFTMSKAVRLNEWTFGGFDIGKKRHPSHLCILGVDKRKRLVQVFSKWMDGWDYTDQLDYVKEAIKHFKVTKLKYDNTRAEFEGFGERGDLPAEMEPISFTSKNKFTMATGLDKLVTGRRIRLVDDKRQKRQLLNVDNDLNAIETDDGHGDCFFSLCLAVDAWMDGQSMGVYTFG